VTVSSLALAQGYGERCPAEGFSPREPRVGTLELDGSLDNRANSVERPDDRIDGPPAHPSRYAEDSRRLPGYRDPSSAADIQRDARARRGNADGSRAPRRRAR